MSKGKIELDAEALQDLKMFLLVDWAGTGLGYSDFVRRSIELWRSITPPSMPEPVPDPQLGEEDVVAFLNENCAGWDSYFTCWRADGEIELLPGWQLRGAQSFALGKDGHMCSMDDRDAVVFVYYWMQEEESS